MQSHVSKRFFGEIWIPKYRSISFFVDCEQKFSGLSAKIFGWNEELPSTCKRRDFWKDKIFFERRVFLTLISDFQLLILGLLAKQNAEGSSKLHFTYPEEHFGKKLLKKIQHFLSFSRKISNFWRYILPWMSKFPSTSPEEKLFEVTEIWEKNYSFPFPKLGANVSNICRKIASRVFKTAFYVSSRPIRKKFFHVKLCNFIFTGLCARSFGFFCEKFI